MRARFLKPSRWMEFVTALFGALSVMMRIGAPIIRSRNCYNCFPRRRSEFPITATELNAMAAPAMIGLRRIRVDG